MSSCADNSDCSSEDEAKDEGNNLNELSENNFFLNNAVLIIALTGVLIVVSVFVKHYCRTYCHRDSSYIVVLVDRCMEAPIIVRSFNVCMGSGIRTSQSEVSRESLSRISEGRNVEIVVNHGDVQNVEEGTMDSEQLTDNNHMHSRSAVEDVNDLTSPSVPPNAAPPPSYTECCPPSYDDFMAKPDIYTQQS